jgi:hypothetical protein
MKNHRTNLTAFCLVIWGPETKLYTDENFSIIVLTQEGLDTFLPIYQEILEFVTKNLKFSHKFSNFSYAGP